MLFKPRHLVWCIIRILLLFMVLSGSLIFLPAVAAYPLLLVVFVGLVLPSLTIALGIAIGATVYYWLDGRRILRIYTDARDLLQEIGSPTEKSRSIRLWVGRLFFVEPLTVSKIQLVLVPQTGEKIQTFIVQARELWRLGNAGAQESVERWEMKRLADMVETSTDGSRASLRGQWLY